MSDFSAHHARPHEQTGGTPAAPSGVQRVLEVAWEAGRTLHAARSFDEVLTGVARAIADAGLYQRAALVLQNEQGDVTAVGYYGTPDDEVTGARHARRLPEALRLALLDPANKISESYFVPAERGIDLSGEGRHIPSVAAPALEKEWQPDDELFVLIRDAGGTTIGHASVDTPFDGRRPDLTTVRWLELLVHLAEEVLERLCMRRRLDAVESRFVNLVTNAEDAIFRANPTANRMEYVNPATEKLTGYAAEYLVSQPLDSLIRQIVHHEDQKKLLSAWGARRTDPGSVETDPAGVEFRLRHRNGDIRWVWQKSIVVYDDDGQVIAVDGIMRDITERHQLAERLAESERTYRLLMENTRDLAYARNTEGHFFWVSPSVQEFFGAAPEEVVGTHVADWLTENALNRAAFEASNAGICRGEAVGPLVLEVRSRTGRTLYMQINESQIRDEHGVVLGVQGVGRDVTESRQAEETLRRSEERFRELADLLPQTVFEIDLAGNLTFANRFARAAFGYAGEELVSGLHASDMVVPEDHERITESMRRMLEGALPRGNEYTALRKDGSTFPAVVYSAPIAQNGRPVGFRGVIVDLTERKQAEEAARAGAERLRSVLENMPVMLDAFDETGDIVVWNRECERVTGYLAEEVVGNPQAIELLYPDPVYRGRMLAAWAARGNDYYDWGWDVTCKDGGVRTVAWSNISQRFPVPGWTTWGIGVDITDRERGEEALRDSERRYQELFQFVMEGIGIVDENEMVQFCNPAFARIYEEEPPETLIGRNLLDYVTDAQREAILSQTGRRKRGESSQYELEIVTRKGNLRAILVSVSPRFDPSGRYIGAFGAVLDITERKRAEDALRASEVNYRTIFDAANDAIFVHDLATGEILDVNQRMCEMYGYTVEEARGLTVLAITADDQIEDLHLRDPLTYRALVEQASREPRLFEWKAKDKAGRIFWVEVNHRPVVLVGKARILANVRDITERKRVMDALRESEETTRTLLNATAEMAMLTDLAGRVLAINNTATRILGERVDDVLGADLHGLVPSALAASLKLHVDQVVRTGQPEPFREELGGRLLVGSIHPLFDGEGKVERLALFARDVTEREQMLRDLRREREKAERAKDALTEIVSELHRKNRLYRTLMKQFENKNAELETMVSMLSHDLKAPLISIREQAARFRRRYARLIDEGGQDLARRISLNAESMLRLVNSLLNYARAQDHLSRIDEVDLGRLVDDIWAQVTDAFPGRRAALRRPPRGISCRFSRLALEQVLSNLLHNAVAYVPPERTPQVEVAWSSDAHRLTFSVADNGCGILEDERDRIFDLFYRVQPAPSEGSGVGLAVVKRIVDAAAGTITLAARAEGGTLFTIELPLAPESQTPA